MKIRAGFVSNSSSTSFLIISKGQLKKKDFMALMGVQEGSPLQAMFEQLFTDLVNQVDCDIDLGTVGEKHSWQSEMGLRKGQQLSERMIEKLDEHRCKGYVAYFGYLNSETTSVQTFFCTDSFEEENDRLYINALENAW